MRKIANWHVAQWLDDGSDDHSAVAHTALIEGFENYEVYKRYCSTLESLDAKPVPPLAEGDYRKYVAGNNL